MSFIFDLVSSVLNYSLNTFISSSEISKGENGRDDSLFLEESSQAQEESPLDMIDDMTDFEIISRKPFQKAPCLSASETLTRTQRIISDINLEEKKAQKQGQQVISKTMSSLSENINGISIETALKINMSNMISTERVIFTSDGILNVYKKIGYGSFGSVYKALYIPKHSTNIEYVAIKVSRVFSCEKSTLESFISVKEESEFLAEFSELDPLDLYPTMKMIGCGSLNSSIYYIIEPLCEMSLHEYIYKSSLVDITVPKVKMIVKQIFKALAHISSSYHDLIHADIKPGNILIESLDPIKIRVADFGSSLRGPQENLMSEYAVTRHYRPPEIFFGTPFDHKVDVWSAGCVAAELLFRSPLFPAEKQEQLLPMYMQFLGSLPVGLVKSTDQIPNYSLVENDRYVLKAGTKSCYIENRMQFFEKNLEIIKDRICLDRMNAYSKQQLLEIDLFREFIFGTLTWTKESRFSAAQALDHSLLQEV